MLKVITIVLMLVVCCYCLENVKNLTEEGRAKKKKNALRLWGTILLLVLSKVAIFKAVSFFLFMAIFQKLFTIAGLAFNYFLKSKAPPKPPPRPMYGAPTPEEYNTIGYSYNPPEVEPITPPEQGYPGLPESFNWLINGNAK